MSPLSQLCATCLLQRACQHVRFNGIAVPGDTDKAAEAAASFNLAALSLAPFPGLFWRPATEDDNDEREDVIAAANLQRGGCQALSI